MNALVIADVGIRQDADGRYCLNDLHVASGGEKKYQPGNWLRLDSTQELIKELDSSDMRNQTNVGSYDIDHIRAIESKQGVGTFACLDLIYDYAMWISAAFKVKVIRAYNALVSAPVLPADPILAQIAILQGVREKQLALESGQQLLAIGIAETRNAVAELKGTMRIENWQQCNIKKAVDHKVSEFRELYPSADVGVLYRKMWRYIKDKFRVPRYNELPAMMYDEVMKTVHNLAMHNLAGL